MVCYFSMETPQSVQETGARMRKNKRTIFIVLVLLFSNMLSFALGYMARGEGEKTPIIIETYGARE